MIEKEKAIVPKNTSALGLADINKILLYSFFNIILNFMPSII